MSWLQDYIGRPWRAEACGPEAYDCSGLVCAVQRDVWCRDVPALRLPGAASHASTLRAALKGWEPCTLDQATDGDVLLVRSTKGPHVGVFVRQTRRLAVLHAHGCVVSGVQRGRVCLSRLDELMSGGYSRPKAWRYTA